MLIKRKNINKETLTPRLSNSGAKLAALANSVVHTGVKSAGWENKMAQLKKTIKR
jgi:hypothetical protein